MGVFKLRDAAADRRMAETGSLARYLPRILLYPLTGACGPVIVVFTVLLWIGVQSLLGIPLLAITSIWLLHYAVAVIDRTALGQSTPPAFDGDMLFLAQFTSLKPLAGVALVIGTTGAAHAAAGAAAAQAVLAALLFAFPAFLFVIAVEGSLMAALNPLRIVAVILRMGFPYLAVCAIGAALGAGAIALAGHASFPVLIVAALYVLLATCHLLGYVGFHRHEALGIAVRQGAEPVTEAAREQQAQSQRFASVLKRVDIALGRKDLQGAADVIYAVPLPEGRAFHEELFQQVAFRRQPAVLHVQGERLIGLLLAEKRAARALDIAETCYDAHRDFAPEHPEQAVLLAEEALRARRDGLFERLTGDAARRYAGHDAAASLAFLTAKFWCEQRRDEARARQILEPLLALTRHPQHRQFAAYHRVLVPRSSS